MFLNKKLLAGIVSLLIFLPILSYAQDQGFGKVAGPYQTGKALTTGLVLCGNPDQPACDFSYAVLMINKIIDWIIGMAGGIFTVSFIYGGFLYMTSGTKLGDKEKAKKILWNTLYGFVIILVSWLIVYTLLNYLVPKDSSIFQFI